MTLRFGYGTNGFADHRLDDALAVIAGLGYDGVALTLDVRHLDPFATGLARTVDKVASRLGTLGLSVVIETGARYLLDPWHKHQPTLVSEVSEPRVDLLVRAVRIAADLGAQAVSFWSGTAADSAPDRILWDRLVRGCAEVVREADARDVILAFEPEPGMFVNTLDRYEHLARLLGDPDRFGIMLDIGHCRCLEPQPVADCVRRAGPRLAGVQIDDMRRGVHEHLEFGTGEIDFPPVLAALGEVGYHELVAVELPRHSHAAPTIARRSIEFLKAAERHAEGSEGHRPRQRDDT
ncbi:sugar phosphate isomerase/epimerase family protein [Actinomadura sp. HBU206391]|uniref:sugar phosphate isomerase/epimerase family protein n=1 Tax=Actinomadura sp. HBU206391 TaxID=2731692 RepID=UPI00164FD264|nr:sugar phosphate isomerase/epimerase family protein [Actinomadura sp. HBU206391]MBC6458303.1 sugar phosphate isomerase/epimerase [Actinomadura sp. HBU206391]